MKRLLILLVVLTIANISNAQDSTAVQKDTTWKVGGLAGVSFTQIYLSNWASGGVNSLSATGLVNLYANYAKKNKKGKKMVEWDNNLILGYGLVRQGDYFDNSVITDKSDDKIDFSSKYGRAASKNWYYTGLINFRSQFTPGYENPGDSAKISDWLAPGYILGAIGMDYKPSKNFTFFASPLTGKVTIVNDEALSAAGAFGVDPNEKVRTELGGYVKLQLTKKFKNDAMENISFSTSLDLFSNYQNNPQNIDVNWETLLALKVNKYISCNLTTQLIYDDDITIAGEDVDGVDFSGPRTQFKQVFGLGISYQF